MFNLVTKLSTRVRCCSRSPSAVRLFSTTNKHHDQFNPNPVALQMIDYAFSLSRSNKSDESYGQGLLVLEQCESNQHDANNKGLVLLAISTLLTERGKLVESIEKLNTFNDLKVSSFPLRVAATEALSGLHLELEEDDTSSVIADVCLNDLDAIKLELGVGFGSLDARARALKGLIELVRGNVDSSQSCFDGVKDNLGTGNDALSYAEFLHTTRDFSTAKQLYQKVIKEIPETNNFTDPYNLAAGNMAWEDIRLAATCALGQLESHMGKFGDAEETLTKALTMTEDRFGSKHPKIGIILTCIALMFRHKATMERSSSLMVQEGLYRRALELLKAPQLETEVEEAKVYKKDIIALARGGYAETLCVQQNRKATGEQMKSWAQAAWNNRRLSLADALDVSSNVPIIDVRISRAL
ncbi:uncharacterized protein [Rutidosis leptorrhynchoides]|uniref:uncharacterized protein isoform X2 n=1 Tax=Rutidosis leptorrhynchoides TaxID=125765 RepID=UPI003A993846